jgi:hypothetical protein
MCFLCSPVNRDITALARDRTHMLPQLNDLTVNQVLSLLWYFELWLFWFAYLCSYFSSRGKLKCLPVTSPLQHEWGYYWLLFIGRASWLLADIMTESSCYFQKWTETCRFLYKCMTNIFSRLFSLNPHASVVVEFILQSHSYVYLIFYIQTFQKLFLNGWLA